MTPHHTPHPTTTHDPTTPPLSTGEGAGGEAPTTPPTLFDQFAAAADAALADAELVKIGQVSDKQFEAWKAQYGSVNTFVVPTADGKEASLLYLRPVDRRVLALLIEADGRRDEQFRVIMNELFLGGDPRFQGSDPAHLPLQAAVMMFLPSQLIEVRYGMLKKS